MDGLGRCISINLVLCYGFVRKKKADFYDLRGLQGLPSSAPPCGWMYVPLSLSLSLSLSPDNIVPFLPRTLDTDRASHTLIGTYLFCLLSLGRRCGVLSIKGYFKVLDVRFIP